METTKILKSDNLYKNIPIIAMTAYAMKGNKESFLKAGCDSYIAKPIRIDELLNIIDKYTLSTS